MKDAWVDELPMVLWAHHTTPKEATGETPFSLVFGTKAIITTKVGLPSYRVENYSKQENDIALLENLDFLKEKRDQASICLETQKNLVAKYYNSRVQPSSILPGDLVLRKVFQNTQEPSVRAFGPNWEGPCKVIESSDQECMSQKTWGVRFSTILVMSSILKNIINRCILM